LFEMASLKKELCIIGAGAIGRSLAWNFSKVQPVSLLYRENPPESLELSCSSSGSPNNNNKRQVQCIDWADLRAGRRFETYFLAVKAYDQAAVLKLLYPHLRANDTVVLLSNGLNMFLEGVEILGKDQPILRGLLFYGAQTKGTSIVSEVGRPRVLLASRESDRDIRLDVGSQFEAAGIEVAQEDNIARAEWRKGVTNLVVNTLCTAANVKNSALNSDPELNRQARELLCEIKIVIERDGFTLEEYQPDNFFAAVEKHGDNLNSTLLDRKLNKKTELSFILNRFLALADSYGLATPAMNQLAALLSEEK